MDHFWPRKLPIYIILTPTMWWVPLNFIKLIYIKLFICKYIHILVYKVHSKPNSFLHSMYIQEKYLENLQIKKNTETHNNVCFKSMVSVFVLSAGFIASQIFLQCAVYDIFCLHFVKCFSSCPFILSFN